MTERIKTDDHPGLAVDENRRFVSRRREELAAANHSSPDKEFP